MLALTAIVLLSCSAPAPTSGLGGAADQPFIYVIGRGWHTDIGLPVASIAGPLMAFGRPFPGVKTLTFGFGDREFLLRQSHTPFALLSALWPGRGALLVTALSTTPYAAFGDGHVVRLSISGDDLARLEARLWHEVETSADQEPIMLARGPYPGSLFYAASAAYSGLYTCNTWTADILHTGNLPVPVAGVLFASQVMGPARWVASRQGLTGRP